MDYLQRLIHQAKVRLFIVLFLSYTLLIGGWWVGSQTLKLNTLELILLVSGLALILAGFIAITTSNYLLQPVKALWQTILHLSPDSSGVAPPKSDDLSFGQELVTNLSTHIYQIINVVDKLKTENTKQSRDLSQNFVAQNLPLPLIILDQSEIIKFANKDAAEYLGIGVSELIGKNIYMVMDMSFTSDDTFDNWLKQVKASLATASRGWERVRLDVRDSHPKRLFDLAAFYNKNNPDQNETILVLFDHTKQYSQDDQAISFVALGVHELRTPLTLLRGYIEVFQEELSNQVEPELRGFMEKMQAQAEQLMAFVNNILNVARVDDDQLELKLEEAVWPSVLKASIEAISIRAKVRGITLKCSIKKPLPTVAVDRLSIQEVVNNIVDNAIKYSGRSNVINIETHLTADNFVETSIQDFGLGIPMSILPNLFSKFYRDHRNRSQVGGTGLGLYLSKAIIKAHGGNLWVRSKEGQGSTFSFTVLPYANLSAEAKANANQGIVRGAHGWIKNHSLYRR